MLCIVALRALSIPSQLPLRPVPGLGIDKRRHPDRNPFALGAPRAALAIAGVAIFEPTQAIRPPDISRLGAIVVGFPFIDGVAEDLDDTTLGPPAVLGLSGWDPLQRETPMGIVSDQRLLQGMVVDNLVSMETVSL